MPAGRTPDKRASPAHNPGTREAGLVIVNYGLNLLVESRDGTLFRCTARSGLVQIVCGDTVNWTQTGKQQGVIEALQPRSSIMHKAGSGNKRRPLAANIDQIVIEAAIEPSLDAFLIDKYTIAAELAGTEPLIVINKADLLDDSGRECIDNQMQEFHNIGYRYLYTSALKNTGIDDFREMLKGKTSILVGQSGVGKSSLVKRLLPDQDIAIGKLSSASGSGRHTTTNTTLYHLPDGGNLIDSPGVRDFHLGSVDPDRLADGFREFRPFLGQCKFNNCRHISEPGCAVTEALEAGRISQRRMESYRRLL